MAGIALGTAATIGLITAGAGALTSGGMAIGAAAKRKKREKELDALAANSPIYKPSKSIQSYYQEAKNRYQESPYQSPEYQAGLKNINQASAEAVFGAQRLGAGIGGVSKIAGNKTNALENLALGIGGRRDQRFRELGQASQAMLGEERMAFDINKQTPYNRKFGLGQYKAQAENERYNRAVAGTFNALGNAASIGMASSGGGKPKGDDMG